MPRPSPVRWISWALILFSLLLLGVALWPTASSNEYIPLVGETLSPAQGVVSPTSPPDYALTLQWPSSLRLGAEATARLTLAAVKGRVPSLPLGFNRVVVAELRASGMDIDPQGEIAEPLLSGGQASFIWTLRPVTQGPENATMFLRLQLVPQGGGDTVERTIWARQLGTRVLSPLGMTQPTELALGVAALIVGLLLMVPRILERIAA